MAAMGENFHESQEGKVGHELKEEMEHKVSKQQEPIPVKPLLPALLEGLREKRAVLEDKGTLGDPQTGTRMSFGEIQEDAYKEDIGFSLGLLGKAQVNEATKA
ncbi:hypothetical protein Nmel_006771 [Mimus melanotis]